MKSRMKVLKRINKISTEDRTPPITEEEPSTPAEPEKEKPTANVCDELWERFVLADSQLKHLSDFLVPKICEAYGEGSSQCTDAKDAERDAEINLEFIIQAIDANGCIELWEKDNKKEASQDNSGKKAARRKARLNKIIYFRL